MSEAKKVEQNTLTENQAEASPAMNERNDPRVDQALGIFSDLSALAVTPTSQIGAREILAAGQIAVRKPRKNEYVRVSADPNQTLTTVVYTDPDSGEVYFVKPELRPAIITGGSTKMLALAINQMGGVFIRPVPVDDELSRRNAYNETAREAYQKAKDDWVLMVGDQAARYYRIYIAQGELPAPTWPDRPFAELLMLAFAHRTIDSMNHPIIKAMRGLTV